MLEQPWADSTSKDRLPRDDMEEQDSLKPIILSPWLISVDVGWLGDFRDMNQATVFF